MMVFLVGKYSLIICFPPQRYRKLDNKILSYVRKQFKTNNTRPLDKTLRKSYTSTIIIPLFHNFYQRIYSKNMRNFTMIEKIGPNTNLI